MTETMTIDANKDETPKGKRTIRTTVRGSVNGYIGGKFWVALGERENPHTDTLADEFLKGA